MGEGGAADLHSYDLTEDMDGGYKGTRLQKILNILRNKSYHT